MKAQLHAILPGQVVPFQQPPRQDELLNTVLDNLAQGVLMFDADMRLVFFNQRFFDMYGISKDIAKSGCTIRDLVEAGVGSAAFPATPASTSRISPSAPPTARNSAASSIWMTAAPSPS
jgi:PAS domain-containing protein